MIMIDDDLPTNAELEHECHIDDVRKSFKELKEMTLSNLEELYGSFKYSDKNDLLFVDLLDQAKKTLENIIPEDFCDD